MDNTQISLLQEAYELGILSAKNNEPQAVEHNQRYIDFSIKNKTAVHLSNDMEFDSAVMGAYHNGYEGHAIDYVSPILQMIQDATPKNAVDLFEAYHEQLNTVVAQGSYNIMENVKIILDQLMNSPINNDSFSAEFLPTINGKAFDSRSYGFVIYTPIGGPGRNFLFTLNPSSEDLNNIVLRIFVFDNFADSPLPPLEGILNASPQRIPGLLCSIYPNTVPGESDLFNVAAVHSKQDFLFEAIIALETVSEFN